MAKVEAAKSRAKDIFNQMSPVSVEPDLRCESDDESDLDKGRQFQEQQRVIDMQRKQLQDKCEWISYSRLYCV